MVKSLEIKSEGFRKKETINGVEISIVPSDEGAYEFWFPQAKPEDVEYGIFKFDAYDNEAEALYERVSQMAESGKSADEILEILRGERDRDFLAMLDETAHSSPSDEIKSELDSLWDDQKPLSEKRADEIRQLRFPSRITHYQRFIPVEGKKGRYYEITIKSDDGYYFEIREVGIDRLAEYAVITKRRGRGKVGEALHPSIKVPVGKLTREKLKDLWKTQRIF